ncbi:uncharacterized protein [Dysidea avara]|uniref:uncharacterized protein n=1 Tax=Dysidea avara TaxID=196820 RepID=UPI003324A775
MQAACDGVRAGQSIRRAAVTYNIPKSTLYDRMTGRVTGNKPGPLPFLSAEEEDEMVSFLEGCASMGYARSKKQVLALVQRVISTKGINRTVGEGWWKSFMKRHGTLALRMAESLSYVRAVCSQPEILNHYYDLLQQTLLDHELEGRPNQIFNLDESGMSLNPISPKIVVAKGAKHSTSVTSNDKSQITVLACCSAAGYAIPPLVVLDRKTLRPEYAFGEVPGTMYALSSNGWMDTELFEEWFKHHFLIHAPSCRPLLLIMDGHSTHLQPCVVRMAAKEDVILFCLPPHSTHLTQPLDKGCFGPLKAAWKEVCHEYMTNNPGKVITRYNFSELFAKAWAQSMTMANITAGFHTTGIFPFNRNALTPLAALTPSKFNPEHLVKGTKLKFLPVYSPSSSKSIPSTYFSEEETMLFTRRYEEGYDLTHDKRYNRWLQLKADKSNVLDEDGKNTDGGGTGFVEECPVVKSLIPPKDTSKEVEPNSEVQIVPKHLENVDLAADKGLTTKETQNDGAAKSIPVLLKRSSALSKVLSSQHIDVKTVAKHPKTSARILTSTENLKMLEEKEKMKIEEAEKKRQRKDEAEKKKMEEAERKRQRKDEAEKKRKEKEKVKMDKEKKKAANNAKAPSQHPTTLDSVKDKVDQEKSKEISVIEEEDDQLWCICREEEYGRMILCENKSCKFGWFHFNCVGLSRKPSGSWYCSDCKT